VMPVTQGADDYVSQAVVTRSGRISRPPTMWPTNEWDMSAAAFHLMSEPSSDVSATVLRYLSMNIMSWIRCAVRESLRYKLLEQGLAVALSILMSLRL
jgi:hypothetical protein